MTQLIYLPKRPVISTESRENQTSGEISINSHSFSEETPSGATGSE